MLIVYASKTGNIDRFLKKTNISNTFKIVSGNEVVSEKFILLTYTTGFGEVPKEVALFLQENYKNIIGVVGSGNKNWGQNFCNAVKLINKKYNTPILMTFEMSGNSYDVKNFLGLIEFLKNNEHHSF